MSRVKSNKPINTKTRAGIARIAKLLGASHHVPVNVLVRKLRRIVGDNDLPLSVKDAALKELQKFALSAFWSGKPAYTPLVRIKSKKKRA